jgi:hypothetical protein
MKILGFSQKKSAKALPISHQNPSGPSVVELSVKPSELASPNVPPKPRLNLENIEKV